ARAAQTPEIVADVVNDKIEKAKLAAAEKIELGNQLTEKDLKFQAAGAAADKEVKARQRAAELEILAGKDGAEYRQAQAAAAVDAQRIATDTKKRAQDLTTGDDLTRRGEVAAADKAQAASINATRLNRLAGDTSYIESVAQGNLAQKRLNRAISQEEARRAGVGGGGLLGRERTTPSITQRLQAAVATRRGQSGDPLDYQTGGQVLASRLLTTASFAASGAVLYGGVQAIRELITQASELQVELSIIEGQFESLESIIDGFDAATGFENFREGILDISRDVGITADEVARVERQLAGALANRETGAPDFNRALTEGRTALAFSKITGLESQEITDSLTAVALAFGEADENGVKTALSFESIADVLLTLEAQFGVLAPEIVKFVADLAPLGAELGFTIEQLAGLGAVAQQVSGKSGAVLAEQLGRILPSIQSQAADVLDIYRTLGTTEGDQIVQNLQEGFADADIPSVLANIVKGYKDLDGAQQNLLVSTVAGRREAATFYALLESSSSTVRVLTEDLSADGAFDERWQKYRETVTFAFDQMRVALEQFGIALFDAGLADGIKFIADAGSVLADVASLILSMFTQLNDATAGWAGELLAVTATILLVNKGLEAMLKLRVAMAAANAAEASSPLGKLTGGPLFATFAQARGVRQVGSLPPVDSFANALPAQRLPRALVTGASKGGVVGGLATGASAAIPVAALLLSIKAITDLQALTNDIDQQIDDLVDDAQAALAKGKTPDEQRRDLATALDQRGTSFLDRIQSFLPRG
ncbi:MAG TPA: phage tail tape measure protein, partial [Thermoleophilia bacterium]|nr:phage tail tape measure protein [Thermoleophilia bacterium]